MFPSWPGDRLLTLEQFLLVAPEFGDTDRLLIGAMLQEAAQELEPSMWGHRLAAGHHYKTADKLALSPMGQNARMITQDGITTYSKHFDRLVKSLGLGVAVAGMPFFGNEWVFGRWFP